MRAYVFALQSPDPTHAPFDGTSLVIAQAMLFEQRFPGVITRWNLPSVKLRFDLFIGMLHHLG